MNTGNDLYRTRMSLMEADRWAELLALAAHGSGDDDEAAVDERRAAAHAVALKAPPALAVAAAELHPDDDHGFSGPLWEVVAHRPWRELAAHLTHPRVRELVAQTRVLHGEDLRGVVESEIPLRLEPWESAHWDPEWDIPEYDVTGGRSGCHVWCFPCWLIDDLPGGVPLRAATVEQVEHPAVPVLNGLNDPHKPIKAYAVQGTAWEAAASVAADRETCRAAEVPFARAYPHLVHLATGTGPYAMPHDTGQAMGRLAVWRVLRMMAGEDPVPAFVERLRCVTWRRPAEYSNFLHLAMEDPARGITWAVTAEATD
ncbi:hypothetical protein [Actinoplanes xinjiangensis]|uniref:hypothetical protein n=1 Tax=Actinoplanes xinjiangensis TaxID=512350 RepID=UPI00130EED51|nr:hypothetical protein [Actinoplanes xinjiangensis]